MTEQAAPSSLGHLPGDKWAFDESVTQVFDDMLERSIPQYRVMRNLVQGTASRVLPEGGRGGVVMDLGCSRGETIASLAEVLPFTRFLGLEVSPPMLESARLRFEGSPRVEIRSWDLREGLPAYTSASLITAVLTIMFVPLERRLGLMSAIANQLLPGGSFIMVEKILGSTSRLDALMVDRYYETKREQGYSEDEIQRKRLALEGVLVPVTAAWNEQMLRSAGFAHVDMFWRWMNFGAWIAIK